MDDRDEQFHIEVAVEMLADAIQEQLLPRGDWFLPTDSVAWRKLAEQEMNERALQFLRALPIAVLRQVAIGRVHIPDLILHCNSSDFGSG